MLSLIIYGVLGIAVAVGVVALLVLILPNDHLAVAPRDAVPVGLPSQPELGAHDVAGVRLPVTLRGYRMVDTDAVLDRLAFELERRDEEIAELRRAAGLPARPAAWPPPEPGTGRDEILGAPPLESYDGAAAGTHPVNVVEGARPTVSVHTTTSARPVDGDAEPATETRSTVE